MRTKIRGWGGGEVARLQLPLRVRERLAWPPKDSSATAMNSIPFYRRQLFGGALAMGIPQGFVDVSDFREIADTQVPGVANSFASARSPAARLALGCRARSRATQISAMR